MFFRSSSVEPRVADAIEAALKAPAETDHESARSKAKRAAGAAVSGGTGLAPQWATFAAAAAVFVILLVASIYVAQQADAQTASVTSSQLKDLSKVVQTLLVAWSAAVIGLIAGEAVGKKSP
jgi:hypothetical protein